MLSEISSRYPGLTLRVAFKRWLARHPQGLRELARDIGLDARDLQAWLDDDKSRFRVAANYEYLDAVIKLDNKERKKPGPKKKLDWNNVNRIKEIGAHEYANKLLAGRKRTLGSPA
jgi:hypothetical protein